MRETKLDLIEEFLCKTLPFLSEDEYLALIKGNDLLVLYDQIAAKIDDGEVPSSYMNRLSDEDLDVVLEYLKEVLLKYGIAF